MINTYLSLLVDDINVYHHKKKEKREMFMYLHTLRNSLWQMKYVIQKCYFEKIKIVLPRIKRDKPRKKLKLQAVIGIFYRIIQFLYKLHLLIFSFHRGVEYMNKILKSWNMRKFQICCIWEWKNMKEGGYSE